MAAATAPVANPRTPRSSEGVGEPDCAPGKGPAGGPPGDDGTRRDRDHLPGHDADAPGDDRGHDDHPRDNLGDNLHDNLHDHFRTDSADGDGAVAHDADRINDLDGGGRMTRLKQALVALVAATAMLGFAVAGPTPARAGGDNVVVAVNTKDGRFLYRVKLVVKRTNKDAVDEANAAAAVASCTDCQTVAVAVEGLLVFSDPSIFTPTNLAIAMNVDCSFCATLASAYQFAVQADGHAHLSGAGRHDIAEIRTDLEAVRRDGLTIAEIQARVDELAQRLLRVLLTELETPPGHR